MTEETQKEISTFTLYLVFLISGLAAVIYQLVWQRCLFTVYGSNWESITVIVTAFLLGLGIGSYWGGRTTLDRKMQPATRFGVLEIFVALFGLISVPLITGVGEMTQTLGVLGAGVLAFLLLLIPTVCMGATLPLLVTHLLKNQPKVGHAVGYLYFVNTLGAGLGCFYAAFFFFGTFGLQKTVWIAAFLDIAAGLIVLSHRPKPIAEVETK